MGSERTVISASLAKLKDHPAQAVAFGEVDDAELKALADNMAKNGLQTPIEIAPDNVIIAGHQRVRAARLLGWKRIDAIIRRDLAEQGAAAIEGRLIEDNFLRRQLSGLARARCIQRLVELELGCPIRSFSGRNLEKLKAKVATQMSLSLRNVNRYLAVLRTIVPIQRLFDLGRIGLADAEKIAILPLAAQTEIARRITAGEKPTTVIGIYAKGKAADGPNNAFRRLVRAMNRELPRIEAGLDRIPASVPRAQPHSARRRI